MENRSLLFIADENIPFLKGLLEPYAEMRYAKGASIDANMAKDADGLLVRTRTHCGKALLGQSKCQFVGTATIGTDHIDLPWCAEHGIAVANAPGCNAPGVAQYVFGALLRLVNRPISQHTIGIVGVGHVGKIVERWARQLDMRVMLCDPPRQAAEGGDGWSTLADIAREADIITFHTPLDSTTWYMADNEFFESLARRPIIINAARGEVVDNAALVQALDRGLVHKAVVDCWENEPNIDLELLKKASVATPHIAGYTYEGKVRATRMLLDAVCQHFQLPAIAMEQVVPAGAASSINAMAIMRSYDPMADTADLRAHPEQFEALRNHYNLRHEVPGGKID